MFLRANPARVSCVKGYTMTYIESQFYAVAPLPVLSGDNGQFRLKITSERGETRWINITPEEFKAIERVLFESRAK